MADFHEDQIVVNVVLTREPADGTDHVYVTAASFDSRTGRQIRSLRRADMTPRMSAARMTGVKNLLDDCLTFLQQQWEIETLVAGPILSQKPPAAREAVVSDGKVDGEPS